MTTTVATPAVRQRPGRSTGRLGRKPRQAVLTAHILTAAGWFGITVVVAAGVVAASATGDVAFAWALRRAVGAAFWVSVPMGLLALATGVALGVGTTWGVLQHWWVVAKLAINVAVMVTDVAVVAPAAHQAVVTATTPSQLYGSTIAHCVVLAVAALLSVYKPRGRTPLGRRRATERAGLRRHRDVQLATQRGIEEQGQMTTMGTTGAATQDQRVGERLWSTRR